MFLPQSCLLICVLLHTVFRIVIGRWHRNVLVVFLGAVYGCSWILPWRSARDTWSNDWERIESEGTSGRTGSTIRGLEQDCRWVDKVQKQVPKLTARPISSNRKCWDLGTMYWFFFFFKFVGVFLSFYINCYENGVIPAASILESSTTVFCKECIHFSEALLAPTAGYPLTNVCQLNVAHISYSVVWNYIPWCSVEIRFLPAMVWWAAQGINICQMDAPLSSSWQTSVMSFCSVCMPVYIYNIPVKQLFHLYICCS